MNCPICNTKDCDVFLLDLMICNSCSHVFKKEPLLSKDVQLRNLHLLINPISEIIKNTESNQEFEFPCMMFYTLLVNPNHFYNSSFNHYFNQVSLMILLEQCNLKIIKQLNSWDNNMCISKIWVIKK